MHLPTARGGCRRDPGPATMVVSLFLPIEAKRDEGKKKKVKWRRQSDTRLTGYRWWHREESIACVAEACGCGIPRAVDQQAPPMSGLRLIPHQGTLRPSCDRIIATVPGYRLEAGAPQCEAGDEVNHSGSTRTSTRGVVEMWRCNRAGSDVLRITPNSIRLL